MHSLGQRPLRELRALGVVLSRQTSLSVLRPVCRMLSDVVGHDSQYRDTFRDLDILQALLRAVLDGYAHACSAVQTSSSVPMLRWDSVSDTHSVSDMRLHPLMIETLQVL